MSSPLAPRHSPPHHVSTARVERALRTAARLVAGPGGDVFVPVFERMERELESRRRKSDSVARAKALLTRATDLDGYSE